MTGYKQALGLALIGAAAMTAPAHAADNAMKVCGAKYQAAKSAKTLPAGQTWQQYLAQCRGGSASKTAARPAMAAAKPAPAASASPGLFGRMMGRLSGGGAAAPAARPAASGGGGTAAMHARQQQCGQQWRAAKAAGHIPAGQTWPQYWSQCNARLKS